jgi:hypothetical protein
MCNGSLTNLRLPDDLYIDIVGEFDDLPVVVLPDLPQLNVYGVECMNTSSLALSDNAETPHLPEKHCREHRGRCPYSRLGGLNTALSLQVTVIPSFCIGFRLLQACQHHSPTLLTKPP